jgi:thymidylate synthase (FAD)
MNIHPLEQLNDVLSPPPEVRVISRPLFETDSFEEFLRSEQTTWKRDSSATPSELIVEVAGRVCYMSFGDKQHRLSNSLYISNLILEGHESVLEHATWSLLFTGVSRAFTHQLVRHRAGFSFSQLSQQYHDESEALFVPPAELRYAPETLKLWAETMRAVRNTYRDLVARLQLEIGMSERERKRAVRSAARSVLPNCTATKVFVTANARSLRHFLTLRGAIIGDVEMREVCSKVCQLMKAEAPALFADFRISTLQDGFPIVINDSHGQQT